jgi:hypothetical protein
MNQEFDRYIYRRRNRISLALFRSVLFRKSRVLMGWMRMGIWCCCGEGRTPRNTLPHVLAHSRTRSLNAPALWSRRAKKWLIVRMDDALHRGSASAHLGISGSTQPRNRATWTFVTVLCLVSTAGSRRTLFRKKHGKTGQANAKSILFVELLRHSVDQAVDLQPCRRYGCDALHVICGVILPMGKDIAIVAGTMLPHPE